MGASASKPDPSEDNIKPNYQAPGNPGDIARIVVEESKTIVSIISSFIKSSEGHDQELNDLVDQFFSHSNSLSAFCNEIESSLKIARDSRLNLRAAVQRFKEERGDGANGSDKYNGTFEELEKFKNSENPFTGLPAILEKVRQQQLELTKKLDNYHKKIEEKQSTTLTWWIATVCVFATLSLALFAGQVYLLYADLLTMTTLLTTTSASIAAGAVLNELFKSYYEGLKQHQDLMDSMIKQGRIEKQKFDEIKLAAEKVENLLQSLKENAKLTLEREEKAKIGFEEIEQNMDHYAKSIEKFRESIEQCSEELKKGREEIEKTWKTKSNSN